MPQATKDIQRRIKSIGSTKKVTRAMEMVSAAKMRKATGNVLSSRSYSTLAWDLVRRLASKTESSFHPLLQKKDKISKVGLVLITSNKGLCGGFNSQIINKAINYIKSQSQNEIEVNLIVMGKKGADFTAKRGYQIIANFDKEDVAVDISEIRPLAKLLIEDYLNGKFDKVTLAYTDFISTLVQKPRIIEILPLDSEADDSDLGKVEDRTLKPEDEEEKKDIGFEYLFEPSADEVLKDLLPRLLEVQIYQAILESNASEHSARMVAMRNASDAASDMIDDLTLVFNKARQSSITAELADISGGRAAVE